MSLSLILGGSWVLASALVAMLPMRFQYAPGLSLLLVALPLLGFIGYQHGFWIAGFGLFAFVSIFRHPLIYLWRRASGQLPKVPR